MESSGKTRRGYITVETKKLIAKVGFSDLS